MLFACEVSWVKIHCRKTRQWFSIDVFSLENWWWWWGWARTIINFITWLRTHLSTIITRNSRCCWRSPLLFIVLANSRKIHVSYLTPCSTTYLRLFRLYNSHESNHHNASINAPHPVYNKRLPNPLKQMLPSTPKRLKGSHGLTLIQSN
jgi:hypothetical protein